MIDHSDEYKETTIIIDQLCTANQQLVDSVINLRESLLTTWNIVLHKEQIQNNLQAELRNARTQYNVIEKTLPNNTLAFLLFPVFAFFIWFFWWSVIYNPKYPLIVGIFCLVMMGAILKYVFGLRLDSYKFLFKPRPEKIEDLLNEISSIKTVISKQQKLCRANREDAEHNLTNQSVYLQNFIKILEDCLTKIRSL